MAGFWEERARAAGLLSEREADFIVRGGGVCFSLRVDRAAKSFSFGRHIVVNLNPHAAPFEGVFLTEEAAREWCCEVAPALRKRQYGCANWQLVEELAAK